MILPDFINTKLVQNAQLYTDRYKLESLDVSSIVG
jgi:hypothetical protein